MNTEWLMTWWNLIFILPFLLALLYLAFYATTGLSFGEPAEAGAEVDADAHVELAAAEGGLDVAHADVHVDAHDHNHEHGHAHGPMPYHLAVLTWLGVGRVPLSLLLMIMLFAWGAIGFSINAYLLDKGTESTRVPLISLPVAAAGALVLTRLMVGFFIRFLPMNETYSGRRHELLGAEGQAMFEINQAGGTVMVRDARGDLFQVPCRVQPPHDAISKGSKVKLIAYNGRKGFFFCTPVS